MADDAADIGTDAVVAGHGTIGDRKQELLSAFSGTEVESILRSFEEDTFRAVVDDFVLQHAAAFRVVCADGSYPLAWTAYHREYRDLFEAQLQQALLRAGIADAALCDFCAFLRDCTDIIEAGEVFEGLRAGDVRKLFDWLTASEDYDAFLHVMFSALRYNHYEVERAAAHGISVPALLGKGVTGCVPRTGGYSETLPTSSVQVSVCVPDSARAGELIQIDYLGCR
eukprot:TRINITY_DN36495_c0_g1_i1.p1 TRINITY_DN36495_c0_g1~~TRINITY_DN36495_c0_g1_i1.p1  ORF type:complete len:226 (+),score=37.03 TRINITY_DN36495_c0_g1_i1:31-708(+)